MDQKNILKKCTKDSSDFSFKGHETYAKCLEVYDGDTCRLKFFYQNQIYQYLCRMKGYNTWELRPKKIGRSEESINKEKELALNAKKRLEELIANKKKLVYIKLENFDKYGRPLIYIYLDEHDKKSINEIMIEEKYGKPYEGGAKPNFEDKN